MRYEIQMRQMLGNKELWSMWSDCTWIEDPIPPMRQRLSELRKLYPDDTFRLVSIQTIITDLESNG